MTYMSYEIIYGNRNICRPQFYGENYYNKYLYLQYCCRENQNVCKFQRQIRLT